MKKISTYKLVLSALFLALGLLLPFLTAQLQSLGSQLLPMHIPVLICGFICGAPYGLIVGFVTPLLRSFIFGMPRLFPMAVGMAFELAAYGALAGLFYKLLPKKPWSIYASLIGAMIGGRIVWGLVSTVLYSMGDTPFSWQIFTAGALFNAIPGIILQIVIIPIIVIALRKSGLIRE